MSEKATWLVVNLTKGWFDGYYASAELANESMNGWKSDFPGDTLLTAQVDQVHGDSWIPEDRFMATVKSREEGS